MAEILSTYNNNRVLDYKSSRHNLQEDELEWSIITTAINQVIITYLTITSPYTNTDGLLSSCKQSFCTLNIETLHQACFGIARIKPGLVKNCK